MCQFFSKLCSVSLILSPDIHSFFHSFIHSLLSLYLESSRLDFNVLLVYMFTVTSFYIINSMFSDCLHFFIH